jgi:ATP-dependent Lon protease
LTINDNNDFNHIKNVSQTATGDIELPLVILDTHVIFPEVLTAIPLVTKTNLNALQYAIEHNTTLITIKKREQPNGDDLLDTLHTIGTEVASGHIAGLQNDVTHALAQGRRRIELVSIKQETPFITVTARVIEDQDTTSDLIESLVTAVLKLFNQSIQFNETTPDNVIDYIMSIENPSKLCDMIASVLPITPDDRQQLLEQLDIEKRLEQLESLLTAELRQNEVLNEVHHRLQDEIESNQREMYLREQMRVIQQELGDGDIFQQELTEVEDKIRLAKLPTEVNNKALKELARLNMMPPMSPESGVIHTYLDWILTLPWKKVSRENLDIEKAEKILDTAHYGLEKVKARIIEHIAVRKLAKNKMKSPILCFVGPPGVGKTSLGKSIADALGRKFLRISLGGVRDEAEIRGHRRTYIGALPGRIIQQMQRAETTNPVFMLDEIDKMSSDFRGDPAAALLEVLDPEQNNQFVDHYLEVPYDLSKVTFITTANDLYSIPEALEDRMEVIEFKGYTEEEKIQIAQQFLIPKQLEANGIAKHGIQFQTSALKNMTRYYTYESGVRNLEREIANVCRKIAKLVATNRKFPQRVTPSLVLKYLGPPQMLDSRVNRKDMIGIVTGLVWTPVGGEIQTIEVSIIPSKGNLTLTGQLGDVLQESAQIALSYLRSRAIAFDIPVDDFENYDVHIHMPEGAVQKDGPSAGITLATALISAFTERHIRSDFAMTGEITLRGHVLPVGGVVEKVLAARRQRIFNLILPKDNEKDLIDIPKPVLKDVQIQFVEDMQQVIDLVLLDPPEQRQRDIDAEAQNQEDENLDNANE